MLELCPQDKCNKAIVPREGTYEGLHLGEYVTFKAPSPDVGNLCYKFKVADSVRGPVKVLVKVDAFGNAFLVEDCGQGSETNLIASSSQWQGIQPKAGVYMAYQEADKARFFDADNVRFDFKANTSMSRKTPVIIIINDDEGNLFSNTQI